MDIKKSKTKTEVTEDKEIWVRVSPVRFLCFPVRD